jgi:hypothetical protein
MGFHKILRFVTSKLLKSGGRIQEKRQNFVELRFPTTPDLPEGLCMAAQRLSAIPG